ncbi:putative disease resistance RPP13-like protein 1, partial [Mucuna pruriens]
MPVVETLGGALLSSILEVAFDRLTSRKVLDYFRGRKLDEKLLSKLNIMLLSMDALAADAEEKQVRDPRVRSWLLAVKDVAFEAEDLLDEIDYQLSKFQVEAGSQSSASKVCNFDMEIESRITQILDDLEFYASQKGYLGLKEASGVGVGVGSGLGSKFSQKVPSTSLVVESVIFGRDDDKEMVFNWLASETNNSNQLSILSIVGMGGVGKTTLAQHVYNDPRIEGKFDIKAWVCVSDDFDVLTVTRAILEAITDSTDNSRGLEMVHRRLKEKLMGKRFFLVLDDVWNEKRDKWEAVQTPLNYGAQGSRILVTTRTMKVASTMRSNKELHLEELREDHCWKVFAKHAFQDDNCWLNGELKEIGIKIVERCKGLPLALKAIGSLLYTKSSVSEWENVLTSEIWDLEDSEIIPALLLSYHHLPSHLKRCFAYCALFPKDYEFDRVDLILLWMAENFLQCSQQSKNPREVGEQYFDDLLSRSFFQQSSGNRTCFVMHDLLNDLAKYICGDICFRLGVDKAKSIPKMTRHFSFAINHVQYFDGFESLYDAKRLRTFMPTSWGMDLLYPWHCKMPIHELFYKFKFLHVLSLCGCSEFTQVPDTVGDLKHLRSIDLSRTDIKKLPDSICSLYNLQILKLSQCRYLEELPSNLHKLTNLCHLEFSDTKVRSLPMKLEKLKNLQVWMSSFYVGRSSELGIQQLGGLNLHGKLSIVGLQNIVNPLDALVVDMKNKIHIVELELEWIGNLHPDDSKKERDVFENLQPSKHLKNLSIKKYGGTQFPRWLFGNSLSNIVSLRLEDCKYCQCLPPLGHFPSLKQLIIIGLDGIVNINADLYGSSSSSFKSLETLLFFDMKEWEEWECKEVTGVFPRLQYLSIVRCPKLKGCMPEQLLRLTTLDIFNCELLIASAPRSLGIIHLRTYLCPKVNIPVTCCYDFLETLEINGSSDSLTTFPLDFFPRLRVLDLNSLNLQVISQEHAHNFLKDLSISECPQFESFPSEGLCAPWLESFRIKGLKNLKLLPKHMSVLLPSLEELDIKDCPQVELLSDAGLPSNLKVMNISNCSKLITSLKRVLMANTSLQTLSIGEVDVESFPDEGLLPLSLTSLHYRSCPDLRKLNYKGLCHLSSLEQLILVYCPNLQCLPEEGLPRSISTLQIWGCPLLQQHFQKPEAKDWGKIADIKNILFAGLVGGALLSSFLQVAFDRLASRQVLDFFRRRKLDNKLLKMLKVKILSINVLVDDAEQKQFRDPRIRDWVIRAKHVVFEAEDILDEIDYELSKCELEAESQTTDSKTRNFFKSSSVSSFDKEIESRMEQVLDDIEDLASQSSYLGLKEASGIGFGSGSGSGSKVSQKLPSTSLVVESVIYGRDDDKELIFNWLTSNTDNSNQLSVLSIVGMGGVGKTTLAQHVYNDPRIEGKFDIKAWVCVYDDFDVLTVTRAILEAITDSIDNSRGLEMVHRRLKENLSGKRFLLVLDDVWNEKREKWEAVQTPLNYGAQGSRILVTTRTTKVASVVRSNKEHHLEQLQEDHCWKVFAKHAFQDDNILPLNDDLKEIGMKIVEKCKGLPLALKTIGSLLHKKSSVVEWENILKSEIWEFSEEDSDIVPALRLSYHHLPSHLKRCFAYCALFPKDYEFDKECLILLWMAEKFLQCSQQSKSPGEVGEQYFNDLLSRSFFQHSSIFKDGFVMHDLLNDLAKYVCGNICFRLGVDKAKCIPNTTRHFSFVIRHTQHFDGFGHLYDAKMLRTFMPTNSRMEFLSDWHCKISVSELLSKFKFLRILSLSNCSGLTEVPDSVGNLKYLRSLDLSHTDIKKLPDSTCSLHNLQILKLSYCRDLQELPSNLHKLTNLCRLEFIDTEVRKVPVHLGKLKNLQVFGSFVVGKSSEFNIQRLGELNLHGRLSISDLHNIENPLDALAADLQTKTHLVELELNWSLNWDWNLADSTKERDVIENLQPSKHLKKLLIRNYGGAQFPSWLLDNLLSNLMCLRLAHCEYCLCLPPLGLLPFLKDLTISGLKGVVVIDADFYGSSSSSFTSLETLKFSFMKEWEKWECQDVTGAFPRLQHLSIEHCPKLKGELPKQLLHLKALEIHECKQLMASVPMTLEIHELELSACGKLQFDYRPTFLKRLTVSGHNMELSLLERIGHIISDTSLEFLCINSCQNMNIPLTCCYDLLVSLKISDGCDSLTTFPLDLFPTLRSLDLRRCRNLQLVSQGHVCDHLNYLRISECPLFESFPECMHILLPSLDKLWIEDCPKVELFPERGLPSNLKEMWLYNCSKLVALLKEALGDNPSLEFLGIGAQEVESFPDEGLLPLSLTSLKISDCGDLKSLDYKGLCSLSSLKKLVIQDCPKLQCLPEEGLPKSISYLIISGNCPFLKQCCQKQKGKDWGKIAHIENLVIESRLDSSDDILDEIQYELSKCEVEDEYQSQTFTCKSLNAELKEFSIKIVEKCKGLPLALKTIGSLLHTKSSISEWESRIGGYFVMHDLLNDLAKYVGS